MIPGDCSRCCNDGREIAGARECPSSRSIEEVDPGAVPTRIVGSSALQSTIVVRIHGLCCDGLVAKVGFSFVSCGDVWMCVIAGNVTVVVVLVSGSVGNVAFALFFLLSCSRCKHWPWMARQENT